jgi:transposase
MIVFGGNNGASSFNDVWALALSDFTWTMLSPAVTPLNPRFRHSAIYDPLRDRMVVFGGWDGTERNDAWQFSLSGTPEWTQLAPGGLFPAPRVAHGGVYSRVRDGMITFGGSFGGIERNDTWALLWGSPAAGVVEPVVPPGIALAITRVRPNPGARHVIVAFALPNSEPAQLEVFDIAGRLVLSHDVGSLGPGSHEVDLSANRQLPVGVYSIRLSQRGRHAVGRTVITR